MSQNFTLLAQTTSKTLNVTRTVGLLATSVRANLTPSRFSERAFVQGDGVEIAQPFTLYCLVTGSSLAAVNDEIETIITAATNTNYVRRDSVTEYRAILGLLNHPPPTRITTTAWELGLTFAPKFARWTGTQTNTLAGYLAALNPPLMDFSDPDNSQFLSVI